jgi:hypothetical protein
MRLAQRQDRSILADHPSGLGDLLQHDPDKARKAMEAILRMDKIDINVMRVACR